MAVSNKWAVLPDIDAAPEVYETPELADDVSTAQTGTLRTISESPSDDEALPGLDRQPLDRDEARRRFEPALVDARGVDFSDSIGGSRRSYRTRSRRRRKRQDNGGVEELGDLSDDDDGEEETLGRKLARLKREAEEVRLELERREQEKDGGGDGEFKDSVEQQHAAAAAGDDHIDTDGVDELNRVLDQLSTKTGVQAGGGATLENEFLSRVDKLRRRGGAQDTKQASPTTTSTQQQEAAQMPPKSALSAVAAFSDRLTALEASLGISSTNAHSQASILPTLDSLSTQITVLSNTLAPSRSSSSSTTTTAATTVTQPTPLLDTVSSKLRTLIAESDRLTASRKQALQALSELHEARMRSLMSHTNTRSRRGYSNASSTQQQQQQPAAPEQQQQQPDESLQIQSQLFLDEQSSKITALYQLLPSIQNLQPLLPVVLERLRALSIVHTGAAEAKNNLDAVEKRQAETREEIGQWRQAVEDVEKRMAELEETMKGNVKVVGDMVSGIEGRMNRLQK